MAQSEPQIKMRYAPHSAHDPKEKAAESRHGEGNAKPGKISKPDGNAQLDIDTEPKHRDPVCSLMIR